MKISNNLQEAFECEGQFSPWRYKFKSHPRTENGTTQGHQFVSGRECSDGMSVP